MGAGIGGGIYRGEEVSAESTCHEVPVSLSHPSIFALVKERGVEMGRGSGALRKFAATDGV